MKTLTPPYECMQFHSDAQVLTDWLVVKPKIKDFLDEYYGDKAFYIPEMDATWTARKIFEWCHQVWQVPGDKLFLVLALKYSDYKLETCSYADNDYFHEGIKWKKKLEIERKTTQ